MEKENSYAELPAVTFSAFIISLGSAALVGLGEVPDPYTREVNRNLMLARHNIDILEMLEFRTKGNLNKDEENLLTNLLCELRLKYVINSDQSRSAGGSV